MDRLRLACKCSGDGERARACGFAPARVCARFAAGGAPGHLHAIIGAYAFLTTEPKIAVSLPAGGIGQRCLMQPAQLWPRHRLDWMCVAWAAASDDFIVTSGNRVILQRLSGRLTPNDPLMWGQSSWLRLCSPRVLDVFGGRASQWPETTELEVRAP